MSVQVGNGFSIGSMGMIVSALAIPAEAPSIAYTSKTTTTITIAHTVPSDTSNYATSKIFYGVTGATPSSVLSSATEAVTLTGLTAGTRYTIYAVSQSAGGAQLASSAPLIVDTSADAGSSKAAAIKAAIKTILIGVSGVTTATVHARARRMPTLEVQRSVSLVDGSVDCWTIEEETLASGWGAVNVAWHAMPNVFVIRTWRELDADDSVNVPDAHRVTIEAAMDALNADITLGGTVQRHDTVQLRRYGFGQQFLRAGKQCSYAELEIATYHTRQP